MNFPLIMVCSVEVRLPHVISSSAPSKCVAEWIITHSSRLFRLVIWVKLKSPSIFLLMFILEDVWVRSSVYKFICFLPKHFSFPLFAYYGMSLSEYQLITFYFSETWWCSAVHEISPSQSWCWYCKIFALLLIFFFFFLKIAKWLH